MELRHVRYFVAVAEERHFGHAAERLHMAQPPLSRQIMLLEQEIGVQLFERTKRRVRLTPAGESFLVKARQLMALADDAVADARRVASGSSGTLSVAFVGSTMFTILPEILSEARARLRDVALSLHEMSTGPQIKAILDGRVQVGFVRPGIVHPDVVSEVILREPILIALPRSHPAAGLSEIQIATLAGDPFVLIASTARPSFTDQTLALCVAAGFTPNVVQEALEIQTVLGLVASDLGVAFVPASVRRIDWPGVVLLPIAAPSPTTELSIAYRRSEPSPILPHFLAIVRELAAIKKML